MQDNFTFDLPKTRELVEKEKQKPTHEERITALEAAMLEQILGGCNND